MVIKNFLNIKPIVVYDVTKVVMFALSIFDISCINNCSTLISHLSFFIVVFFLFVVFDSGDDSVPVLYLFKNLFVFLRYIFVI